MKKLAKFIIFPAVFLAAIFALLLYYQDQGFIKIFPTSEDRQYKKVLEIDESKFSAPSGLSEEFFNQKIEDLKAQKEIVLQDFTKAPAWESFGSLKSFLNDYQGAVAAWEVALQLEPTDFIVAINLGNAYQYFVKDVQKAEDSYNKALAVRADLTSAYEGLMDLYRYNFPEKIDQYEPLVLTAIEYDELNEAAYYSNLVQFFMETNKDIGKAEYYLEKVKELKPESAEFLLDLYPELN